MTLLEKTIALLQNRPAKLELKQIAKDLPDITYSWLCMFNQGKIKNPGIKQVETVYAYLVEKHLDQPKFPV